MIIIDTGYMDFEVSVERFPNGEARIEFSTVQLEEIRTATRIRLVWMYRDDSEFLTLQFVRQKLADLVPNKDVELLIPYMPYARMDRIKEDGQFETSKYLMKLLRDLNFSSIVTYDLHSHRAIDALGLGDVVRSIPKQPDLVAHATYNRDNIVLVFPDASAEQRYGCTCRPTITVKKTRDFNTGKILGFEVLDRDGVDLNGKLLVMVDDICSYGGTFVGAYDAIKQYAAEKGWTLEGFILCVTHLEPTYKAGPLVKHPDLKQIICRKTMDWQLDAEPYYSILTFDF